MLGCLPHGVANLQICANDANDVAKCLNEAQNLLKLSQQFAELLVCLWAEKVLRVLGKLKQK